MALNEARHELRETVNMLLGLRALYVKKKKESLIEAMDRRIQAVQMAISIIEADIPRSRKQ